MFEPLGLFLMYSALCCSDVMTPMPVGHPEIINFVEKVEIGTASKDLGNNMI